MSTRAKRVPLPGQSPPYAAILSAINEGRVVPFLGAGASLNGASNGSGWQPDEPHCPPTADELARYLAHLGEFPHDDLADLKLRPQAKQKVLEYFSPELTKAAQWYSLNVGRSPLNSELDKIFNCNYPLTPLHKFLASVERPLVIITTNYDDLIERAFDEAGRDYSVLVQTTDPGLGDLMLYRRSRSAGLEQVQPNELDIGFGTTTVIYKMHGAVDRQEMKNGQYIITEDDYVNFLTRMMKEHTPPPAFVRYLSTPRHFLFLGYGLNDWNLRVLLRSLDQRVRNFDSNLQSWAIQLRAKLTEKKFWEKRNVSVYEMSIDDFVKQIESRRPR